MGSQVRYRALTDDRLLKAYQPQGIIQAIQIPDVSFTNELLTYSTKELSTTPLLLMGS